MISQILAATNNALQWPFIFRAFFFTSLVAGLPSAALHWGKDPLPPVVSGEDPLLPKKQTVPDTTTEASSQVRRQGPYDWLFDVESATLLLSVFVIGMTMATTATCLTLSLRIFRPQMIDGRLCSHH